MIKMTIKKSKNYWEKRAERQEKKVYKEGDKLLKELDKNLNNARKEIQKSINDLVARYMELTELSYTDAMRNLTSSEFREWRMTLEEYMAEIEKFKGIDEKIADKLKLELETLAMKSRISRLDTLKAQIDMELNRKAYTEHKALKGTLETVYNDSYRDIRLDFGVESSVAYLDTDTLSDLINYPWSGTDFSNRIWENRAALGRVLKEEIIQSFIQGISVKDLSDKIMGRMNSDRKNTERLVRTELNYALNQATKKGYKDSEVEEYEYLAEIDSRTSPQCRELNGKIFKLKDAKVGINYPPMHPHCRSTTIPVIEYEALKESEKNGIIKIKEKVEKISMNNAKVDDILVIGEMIEKEFDIKSFIGNKEKLKEIFSNFREMGGVIPKEIWGKGTSKIVKAQLEDAFSYYPKDWGEIPKKCNRQLYVRKVDRGYFAVGAVKRSRYDITLENYKDGFLTIATNGERITTPFHEIGHMVEWFNKDVVRLEKEWVEKRTQGEEEIKLSKLFPFSGYSPKEVTKKDKFISPYIGKTYRDATEVLSMGLESLFTGTKQVQSFDVEKKEYVKKGIEDDKEFLHLIIGLIVKG